MKKRPALFFLLTMLVFSSLLHVLSNVLHFTFGGYELRGWTWLENGSVTSDSIVKKKSTAYSPLSCTKLISYPSTTKEDIDLYVDSLERFLSRPLSDSLFVESPYLINCQRKDGSFPLDDFFEALYRMSNDSTGLIRVAHYGDSQIEGDRLTDQLRILFQTYFPGNGVGYVPLMDITDPVSYTRQAGPEWTRYSIFKNKTKEYPYGVGGTCFRYNSDRGGKITIRLSRPYQNATLAYGKGSAESTVEVYSVNPRQLLGTYRLNATDEFIRLPLPACAGIDNLEFHFNGPSPVLYGFFFDPAYGIQFDNYGLRGQSGDGLLLIPKAHFQKMLEGLNTQLSILQFGGNVVPGLQNDKAVNFYGNVYKKTYGYVQNTMGGKSPLIIGVNDVSRASGGTYKSYPNIGALRYAQRAAAYDQEMAFFDLLQWMGGENAIRVWFDRGLCSRDGHFSTKGRIMVARALFVSLMYEYRQFVKRKENKNTSQTDN